jgi:GGDEF domain-containing protein
MTGAVPEPARLPHLVLVEGEGAGRSFALTKPTTIIGRDPNTDIVLPHATVSWHHAAITVAPDGIVAEDLESLNGTFVGVARIGRRALAHGDVLAVGYRAVLKLTWLPPPASDNQARARAETPAEGEGSIAWAANAAALAERLRKERATADPAGVSLVLMFVRIDGAFRHTEVSEAVMRRIAVVCRAAIDAGDLLARASDRELILLLRQTIGRAVRTARKIRSLAAKQLKGTGAAGGAMIATAALVPLPAHTARSAETLLRVANRKAGRSLRRARHGSDPLLRPPGRTTNRTATDRTTDRTATDRTTPDRTTTDR